MEMGNSARSLAEDFILHTAETVFLTGKAGTGKTTLLRTLREKLQKKFVVLAPTGVAAIQAGGMTIHSFFQIPPGNFLPDYRGTGFYTQLTNRMQLSEHMRYSKVKRDLIRELQLIVIDEVSMMRADLLDAVDFILRQVRRMPNVPFGGVQMLFIGDLYQLPPVVKDDEWLPLKSYYTTPYFFSALVMQELQPVYVELKTIYRQSEGPFVELLNRVRHNACDEEDFLRLNARNIRESQDTDAEDFVTLCTHNWKVDKINESRLRRIPEEETVLQAVIDRDFPEKIYPVDAALRLKPGAQVMFMRNDSSGAKRYYNGRLAIVTRIWEDGLMVRFLDNQQEFDVERETWENIRYSFREDEDKIAEEIAGTFSQFPLRLAWAVTIHKSQGLTFDRIVIDAGAAFAFGQVYVALSRCRTLEGIQLMTPIDATSILSDERIVRYVEQIEQDEEVLKNRLESAALHYAKEQLKQAFRFDKLLAGVQQLEADTINRQFELKDEILILLRQSRLLLEKLMQVAKKFNPELLRLLETTHSRHHISPELTDRMEKAITYFGQTLHNDIWKPLLVYRDELLVKKKTKTYLKEYNLLVGMTGMRLRQLQQLQFIARPLYTGRPFIEENTEKEPGSAKSQTATAEKISTYDHTLILAQKGLSIQEMAAARSMTASTIESHLARLIESGQIDIKRYMTADRLDELRQRTASLTNPNLNSLKTKAGNDFGWGELKMYLAWLKHLKNSRK